MYTAFDLKFLNQYHFNTSAQSADYMKMSIAKSFSQHSKRTQRTYTIFIFPITPHAEDHNLSVPE